jgi:D-serine deaminase-like pyridoxal phosphate-dependent protein
MEMNMPVLLLDKEKCLANIGRMATKASARGLVLRPHFKTHQSAEVGSWFRDFGASTITVSSLRMAAYFADAGWEEILVAFPFIPGDLTLLNALAGRCRASILLDNPTALTFLGRLEHPVEWYLDTDTGYGRSGIPAEEPEAMDQLLKDAGSNPKLAFRGFYCHAGHSYKAGNREERDAIHRKAMQDLDWLKGQFSHLDPLVLYGDTPSCSIQEDFGAVDQITPGNFVFYDLFQHTIGSCTADEIAVAMACPVAGKYPDGRRILVHGGAVHFSKETLPVPPATRGHGGAVPGHPVYGLVVERTDEGWSQPTTENYLTGLSQEHGILEGCGELYDRVNIGDTLFILPVHSCLTANLMGNYRTLEGQVIETINTAYNGIHTH